MCVIIQKKYKFKKVEVNFSYIRIRKGKFELISKPLKIT